MSNSGRSRPVSPATAVGGKLAAKAGNASPLSTYLNILKNVLGAGMLQMPFVFSLLGYALGPMVIAVVQLGAAGALFLLMRACDAARMLGHDASSYNGLAQAAWGARASTLIDLLVLCYTGGVLVGYGVLIVDFFSTPLNTLVGWTPSRTGLLTFSAVAILPLCCLRSIDGLRATSMAGNAALLYAVLLVVFAHTDPGDGVEVQAFGRGAGLLQACPMLIFSYNFHYNLPVYYSELAGRTPRKMLTIVAAVFATVTLAYLSIGLVGYSRWGSTAQPNIMNNYPPDSTAFVLGRLGLGSMIVCTYPIIQFATRGAALRLLGLSNSLGTRAVTSAALVTSTMALSVAVPNVGVAIAYDAAIFGVVQHFILPGFFFLTLSAKTGAAEATRWQRLGAVAAIIVGSSVGVLGVIGTTIRL